MLIMIDNYDSFTYNLYQILASFDPDIHVIRNDEMSVAQIKALHPSGIIISPGPGRPEDAGVCVELLQSVGNTVPVLGVCLGLQAMVVAFGGQVIAAPEIVHGKQDAIFHERQGLYQHLPLPFQAGRYHSLMADPATLPSMLRIDAMNAQGLIMGLSHRDFPIFGVQFHPESILTPTGEKILRNFSKYTVFARAA